MIKAYIFWGALVLLLAAGARADIGIESVDLNTPFHYTLSSIGIDVNVSYDSNYAVDLQFYDNGALMQTLDLNSPDGNTHYETVHFASTFTEGHHTLDFNLNKDGLEYAVETIAINVLTNPWLIGGDISWEIIQQYVMPLTTSLAFCTAEKADLNILFTQSQATMKAMQNDVAVANASKQEAENLLAMKKTEIASCASARATCEADKATTDSKYQGCRAECETQKAELKSEKDSQCNSVVAVKDDAIQGRDDMVLELNLAKNNMEYVAVFFGIMFLGTCCLVGFLVWKDRIKGVRVR